MRPTQTGGARDREADTSNRHEPSKTPVEDKSRGFRPESDRHQLLRVYHQQFDYCSKLEERHSTYRLGANHPLEFL